MNKIRIAQKSDWRHFFKLADAEGWRVPEVERQLLATNGFTCVGCNALTAQGDTTRGQIKTMVSLASLGSIG